MQSSLVATFSRPYGQPTRKGPYPCLRFEGELVREGPGGPVVARHENHHWVVDGEVYSRLDFEEVKVHFSRADARSVFAFVDRSLGDWYCHDDGQHWPLMVVEPASV